MRRLPSVILFGLLAPLVWLGCNAILGNEDARFSPGADGGDENATGTDDGGPNGLDGGPGADGGACDANLLVDPNNCGGCGHDCLGGGCEAGTCGPVLIATDAKDIVGLTFDTTHVYWSDSAPSIRRAPLASPTGGAGELVYGGASDEIIDGVARDSNRIYFSHGPIAGGGSVDSCDVNACMTETSPVVAVGAAGHLSIAGATLFWVDGAGGLIGSCPLPSCSPLSTIGNQPFPEAITVDGTEVFWASLVAHYVRSATIASGSVLSIVEDAGLGTVSTIGVSGDRVFFTELGNGIFVANRDGSGSSARFSPVSDVRELVADGTDVYFADYAGLGIFRCSRTDCSKPVRIASSPTNPTLLRRDAKGFLWATQSATANAQIWRLVR